MEPSSPKKIQFDVPPLQGQLDPQAAEHVSVSEHVCGVDGVGSRMWGLNGASICDLVSLVWNFLCVGADQHVCRSRSYENCCLCIWVTACVFNEPVVFELPCMWHMWVFRWFVFMSIGKEFIHICLFVSRCYEGLKEKHTLKYTIKLCNTKKKHIQWCILYSWNIHCSNPSLLVITNVFLHLLFLV